MAYQARVDYSGGRVSVSVFAVFDTTGAAAFQAALDADAVRHLAEEDRENDVLVTASVREFAPPVAPPEAPAPPEKRAVARRVRAGALIKPVALGGGAAARDPDRRER